MSSHGTAFAAPKHLRGGVSVVSLNGDTSPQGYIPFPQACIAYRIEDTNFFYEAARLFGIDRLHHVRQFGLLAGPGHPRKRALYRHTRGRHSYDVAVIAMLIAERIGLSDADRDVLRLAAFTHDARTPAWSDRTKFLDPAGLDEDEHYHKLLERPEITRFLDHHHIPSAFLIATIKGQGLTGSVLDVADKCAYVARDVETHLAFDLELFDPIRLHVQQQSRAAAIWETSVSVGDRVAFSYPRRLASFLLLRALNFRQIYHHPHARLAEEVAALMALERIYLAKRISNEDLLRMTDRELESRLTVEPECRGMTWEDGAFHACHYLPFNTLDEAKAYMPRLQAQGIRRMQLFTESVLFKPATHLLVRTKNVVQPYVKTFPADAARIHEAGRSDCSFAILLDPREIKAKHLTLPTPV